MLVVSNLYAAAKVVHLYVGSQLVNYAGKTRSAIVVNHQLPAPTLHFKENDQVVIYVHNQLAEETAIHWHGVLVPWQMDGVLGVSQKGIAPGGTYKYQFTLKQSGTYWYHAHAGLQEQEGLYGGFIVDPVNPPAYSYTKDFTVVLSDWSNTSANHILANLKKEGGYYAPQFPLQPSLQRFLQEYKKASKSGRKDLTNDYLSMQKTRMNRYDLSDVAYDAFLMNGHNRQHPWIARVKKGDVVRLRFIGAGGSTIFNVKIPHSTMKMIHVQGNDIRPYEVDHFSIAPGETYDVLVKINKNEPYIIYAESRDKVGSVAGALITKKNQNVNYHNIPPFPEPQSATQEMMDLMMAANKQGYLPKVASSMNPSAGHMHHHGSRHSMSHNMTMTMPIEPSVKNDSLSPSSTLYTTTQGTKYQPMRAAEPTNNPYKPIANVIQMELFGYMDRFIWFINGTPEYDAHPIELNPGRRYRFVFTNNSMMHHPMHIHGHWFILRKGDNAYDPLLHTIDVPPGATITADVDTDASGQWFSHCHMLFHMTTGMSRVFQYSTLIDIVHDKKKPEHVVKSTPYHNRPIIRVDEFYPINTSLIKHPMAHPPGFWFANFLDMGGDPFHHAARLSYKGLFGPDYHKLELFIDDAEVVKGSLENADLDIFYWHLISQFLALKGGINYFNEPASKPYWQPGIGLEGLMPYFIDTNARVYFYQGSVKLDIELSRDTQITNNFLVRTGLRSLLATHTVAEAGIGNGLNQMRYMVRPYYRLIPGVSVFVEYEHEQNYGAFKLIELGLGDSPTQDTVTFGLMTIF